MQQKKILRLGAACLIFSVFLRLAGQGFFQSAVNAVCSDEMLSLLLYAQTGRVIRTDAPKIDPAPENSTFPTQITQQSEPQPSEPDAVISFSADDLDMIEVYYYCDYAPDISALLTAPLDMDLRSGEPTVLILHSHGSECYTGTQEQVEPYRSLDDSQNMIAVGDQVAQLLEAGGITVVHDRNIYDYPDYNGAYTAARKAIQAYLAEYPTIQLVLDLHRDAADGDAGQLVTSATVDGQPSAQLMMVVGTDGTGLYHPDWQENLALALKLNVLLEQENPGITRPISLRSQRFNMDLTPGSLLIEVGAAGNTLEEAKTAATALAEAILKLAGGSG